MNFRSGRHFLHVPGPTNVPDRVLRAMSRPTIDHRGPQFAELTGRLLTGLRDAFGNPDGDVIIYPASGSGGWEASISNTMRPGDRVLMFDQGFFAQGWRRTASAFGLEVDLVEHDWSLPVSVDAVEQQLRYDNGAEPYKSLMIVHNETTTGVTTDIPAIRAALDAANHDALLMVDAVSSLGSMPLEQAEWGVDVIVCGSQKGLMLPPGLAFNSISPKALRAHDNASLPNAYWDWVAMRTQNQSGFFPYTPATNLLFGLEEALAMLFEEGLYAVFARHSRLAAATRAAVQAWGLRVFCSDPNAYSSSVTAVAVPGGVDADDLRAVILDNFDLSLGTGLGKLQGQVFRIGHLGDINDLMLAGVLSGIEMGLRLAGVEHQSGGVAAALEELASTAPTAPTAPSRPRADPQRIR